MTGFLDTALSLLDAATDPARAAQSLTGNPVADVPVDVLRAMLVPLTLARASNAGTRTGLGILAAPKLEQSAGLPPAQRPGVLQTAPEGIATFAQNVAQQGLDRALVAAQERWAAAPEQPYEKMVAETVADPMTWLSAGTNKIPAALRAVAPEAGVAGKALRAAATAAEVPQGMFDVLGQELQLAGRVARPVAEKIPGVNWAIAADKSAQLTRAERAVRGTFGQTAADAKRLGLEVPEGQLSRTLTAPLQDPKTRDVLTRVEDLSGLSRNDAPLRTLTQEFFQDFGNADSALKYLGLNRLNGQRPTRFADVVAAAEERMPAIPGVLQRAKQLLAEDINRIPEERLYFTPAESGRVNERLTVQPLLKAIDDAMVELGTGRGVIEARGRWTTLLKFLQERYGDAADALLPGQRNNATEAILYRLRQENGIFTGPAAPAGPATARMQPPPPAAPLDPLAQLQAANPALGNLAESLAPRVAELDKLRAALPGALDTLGLGQVPWENALRQARDIGRTALADSVEGKAASLVQKAGVQYGGLDVRNLAQQDEALIRNVLMDQATKLGIKPESLAGKTWDEITTAWRQQALAAPAYLVYNVTDALFKSLIYLGNKGFIDLPQNVGQSLVNTFPSLADQGTRQGQALTRILAQFRKGPAEAGASGPVWTAWQDMTGAVTPHSIMASQAATEARAGKGFERVPGVGRAFEAWREIGQAVEQSFRKAAFIQGYERRAAEGAPQLADQLAVLVRPADQQAVRAAIVQRKGLIRLDEVRDLLQQHGATNAQVLDGYRALATLRQEASQAGEQLAFKLHFDYGDTTNADALLRKVTGFHFFATRNLPLYTEIFATNPLLFNAMQRYDALSREYATTEGYDKRKRFEQSLPIPGANVVAEALFRRPGELMLNPLRYLSGAGQFFGEPYSARDTTGVGEALNVANQVGLSLNPLVKTALAPTGIFGAQQPQNLFRVEPLVKAALQQATGQVPQTPLDLYQRLRVPGQAVPADPYNATRQRLGEASLEMVAPWAQANPQSPVAPPYVAAMRDPAGTPQGRIATSELGQQAFVERLLAFMGLPVGFRGATTARIERATAGVPEANADTGRSPFDPVLPRENYQPGQAYIGPAQREALLRAIAASGKPEALVPLEALKRSATPDQAEGAQGRVQAYKEAILTEYATASPSRREAMWRDPQLGAVLLQAMVFGSQGPRQGPAPLRQPLAPELPATGTLVRR